MNNELRMRNISWAIWVVIILYFSFVIPTTVSAHVLATDQSIGAVMHIDPNDQPVLNQPAYLFFEFKDKTNKFNPANCNCNLAILENGQQIFSQPLYQGNNAPSLTNATATYTFSKKDVYQIQVTGTPTVANAFQPFTLTYDIRVDQGQQNTQNPQNMLPILIAVVVIASLVVLFLVIVKLKNPKI